MLRAALPILGMEYLERRPFFTESMEQAKTDSLQLIRNAELSLSRQLNFARPEVFVNVR
jgi:hypothetical protein